MSVSIYVGDFLQITSEPIGHWFVMVNISCWNWFLELSHKLSEVARAQPRLHSCVSYH